MIFTTTDLEILLERAVETNRDLTVTINADGTYEASFNIPSKTIHTMTYEPSEGLTSKQDVIQAYDNVLKRIDSFEEALRPLSAGQEAILKDLRLNVERMRRGDEQE